MRLGKALIVLVICVALLFLLPVCAYMLRLGPDPNLIQAAGLAVVLVGSFLGGYYQLQNLQLTLREERKKEIRQQKLTLLDDIESLVKHIGSTFGKIATLDKRRQESQHGELPISLQEIQPLQVELTTLEAEIQMERGRVKTLIDDEELTSKLRLMQVRLNESEYMLSLKEFPISDVVIPEIAEVRQAIDRARQRELEHG